MSSLVKGYDRRTGTTYVYHSVSYWDPVKKRPSAHRRCVGKIDPITGEIVPTGKPGRPKKAKTTEDVPVTDKPAGNETDSPREVQKLQKQLLESIEHVQELEAKLKAVESEKRQLEQKLSCMAETLGTLKKAFANHCAAFEGL